MRDEDYMFENLYLLTLTIHVDERVVVVLATGQLP